jgi:hypothetical protein
MRGVVTKLLNYFKHPNNPAQKVEGATSLLLLKAASPISIQCNCRNYSPATSYHKLLLSYAICARSFFQKVNTIDWFNNQYNLSLTLYCCQMASIATLRRPKFETK